MKNKLVYPILSLGLVLAGGAGIAHAQIIGEVEATIPFQFQAGTAVLPAGKYTIREANDLDSSEIEIRSADGKKAAIFAVQSDEAGETPKNSELIFKHDGDQYILKSFFEAGHKFGDMVTAPRIAKNLTVSETSPQEIHVSVTQSGN